MNANKARAERDAKRKKITASILFAIFVGVFGGAGFAVGAGNCDGFWPFCGRDKKSDSAIFEVIEIFQVNGQAATDKKSLDDNRSGEKMIAQETANESAQENPQPQNIANADAKKISAAPNEIETEVANEKLSPTNAENAESVSPTAEKLSSENANINNLAPQNEIETKSFATKIQEKNPTIATNEKVEILVNEENSDAANDAEISVDQDWQTNLRPFWRQIIDEVDTARESFADEHKNDAAGGVIFGNIIAADDREVAIIIHEPLLDLPIDHAAENIERNEEAESAEASAEDADKNSGPSSFDLSPPISLSEKSATEKNVAESVIAESAILETGDEENIVAENDDAEINKLADAENAENAEDMNNASEESAKNSEEKTAASLAEEIATETVPAVSETFSTPPIETAEIIEQVETVETIEPANHPKTNAEITVAEKAPTQNREITLTLLREKPTEIIAADRRDLAAIKQRGALIVGMTAENREPFFSFTDGENPRGCDYDWTVKIARNLGVDLTIVRAFHSEAELLDAVERGVIDTAISGLQIPTETSRGVRFSAPYFGSFFTVAVDLPALAKKFPQHGFLEVADLNFPDVTIAVEAESNAEKLAAQIFPRANLLRIAARDRDTIFTRLFTKQTDAVLIDNLAMSVSRKINATDWKNHAEIVVKRLKKSAGLYGAAVAQSAPALRRYLDELADASALMP